MTSQVVRMPRTGDSLQVGAQTEAPQNEGMRVLSDDETSFLRPMLLLEYQEAEDRLARLKQRAVVIGNDIQQFGQWLAEDPTTKIYVIGQDQYGLPVDFLPLRRYDQCLDFNKAINLADQLRAATAILKDLAEQKERFGLR